jgi:hypothetical protein
LFRNPTKRRAERYSLAIRREFNVLDRFVEVEVVEYHTSAKVDHEGTTI